jgi:penicillin-insensitive murein endopeptidase
MTDRHSRQGSRMLDRFGLALVAATLLAGPAAAQDKGTVDPKPLPPLANPSDPKTPARELFGRATSGAPMDAEPIGFYSHGCLAGGVELPVNGPHWQVMRLSRHRNWGHPQLVAYIERLSETASRASGWPGLLIGDMSQPRGGPMLTGHASHQIGLDADIWLTPMPPRELTREEREEMSATMMVREDRRDVAPGWTDGHVAVLRAAAEDPAVERIFVNAAIKRALCRVAAGQPWMHKVRPYYGHDYHFHVRLSCPKDSENCTPQAPVGGGDGCDASLAHWFSPDILNWKPSGKSWPPMTLSGLPAECRQVLKAK